MPFYTRPLEVDDFTTPFGRDLIEADGPAAARQLLQVNDGGLIEGEGSIPRESVASVVVGTTSGFLRLSYWTADKDELVGTMVIWSGSTAAGATPTLVRTGLWTAETDGSLIALIGAIPNDTSLLASSNTIYSRAMSAPAATVRGQRYASGLLVVTGATAPTVTGSTAGAQSSVLSQAPFKCGTIAGQADLPAGPVAAGAITAGLNRPYIVVKP